MISMKLLNRLSKSPRNKLFLKPSFPFSFDCQNCSKKTALPECTACHRMVNYFMIFDMYLCPNPVPNPTKLTLKQSPTKPSNSKSSTIPTSTLSRYKSKTLSISKTLTTIQRTSTTPKPHFWMI